MPMWNMNCHAKPPSKMKKEHKTKVRNKATTKNIILKTLEKIQKKK